MRRAEGDLPRERLVRKLPKCTSCGCLLCFMCHVHVDAPDQGLRVVCEDCAEEICKSNDLDVVSPGGLIHLEAYYSLDIEDDPGRRLN